MDRRNKGSRNRLVYAGEVTRLPVVPMSLERLAGRRPDDELDGNAAVWVFGRPSPKTFRAAGRAGPRSSSLMSSHAP
jgi:hypothetical protein